MQLILNPSQYDVLLCENMFGDILSDEAAAWRAWNAAQCKSGRDLGIERDTFGFMSRRAARTGYCGQESG